MILSNHEHGKKHVLCQYSDHLQSMKRKEHKGEAKMKDIYNAFFPCLERICDANSLNLFSSFLFVL